MSRHRHSLLGGGTNQIIVWGTTWDDGAPVTLVPPNKANMLAGDLVYVFMTAGGGGIRDLTIPNAGGQTWTFVKIRDGNVSGLPSIWDCFCTFNGTWTANPQFSISGSVVSKLYVMNVMRPPVPGGFWTTDQGPTNASNTGSGSPGSYVCPGMTNTVNKPNVTIFALQNYSSGFNSLSGAYWKLLGPEFYLAAGANARTGTLIYQIQGFINPVGATGNATIGGDTAPTTAQLTRHSWYYTAP